MEFMETTVSQEYKFKGRVINTRVDQILLPNGKPAEREVVEHTGGVCVGALTKEGEILLVRQFRYPSVRNISSKEAFAGIVPICSHGKCGQRQQIDSVSFFQNIQVPIPRADADHIGDASPLACGSTHPQHVMIAPLDIHRVMLHQFFHDNMRSGPSIIDISYDMQMIYGKPLDQLA